jgi:DNA-binding SARP family transcriptional activator/DNA-binding CsgD family transcriptional regulator
MDGAATRVQLCGRLRVEIDGRPVEGDLPGRQGRLLLAYLVINRDRPVRRDELIEALWPDAQPASGDALLRPPLSRLRKALGPDRIEGRSELTLMLPADAYVDWEAARAALVASREALAQGDYRAVSARASEAAEIADRGLLPGLEAEWIDERRRELEELRTEALEAIATAGVAQGGPALADAERAARAAVEAAPFRESAHAALMEALGAAGNVAEALRAYDDLRTILRDELGTTPSPRVVSLYERLLKAEEDPAAFAPPEPPRPKRRPRPAVDASRNGGPHIVERDDELTRLTRLFDEAAAGHGRVALIEGPAGIGKSRLLVELRARAGEADALVLAARGSELEREFPFGAVRQLFEAAVADPSSEALAGAAAPARAVFEPAAGDDAAGDASFSALHGLFWLCVNLASEGPLVLAVDDLHWIDRPSLRFIAYLTQRLEGLPILVATTLRSGEPPTDPLLLAEVMQDPSTEPVRPRPLTEAAVRELVRERLGPDADEEFCRACHRATVGNPLLVRQLLTALETDHVRPEAANAHVVREIGQGAVSRSVVGRLTRLGPEAAEVARAVAVLGEHAELPTLAALAELDEQQVATASAALARAEILLAERPAGFVHPLVRDAVYHELSQSEREVRHARAAQILSDAGAPPEQVASHLLAMPQRGNGWVSDMLQSAARDASRKGAADSAVAYLRRALEEPPPDDRRPQVEIELGMAEWLTNAPAAAKHLQAGYAALTDPVERAAAAEFLGRALLFTDETENGAELARRALAALPPGHDDLHDRLEAFVLVTALFGVHDIDDIERIAGMEPPPVGAPVGRKMLASVAALFNAYRGRPTADAAELAAAALADGDLIGADNGLLSTSAIITLTLADRHEEAVAAWESATADAYRRGSLFGVSSVHLWRGFTLLWHGDLFEAESLLKQAWASFDLFGYGTHAALYRSAFEAWVELERGNLDGARTALRDGFDIRENADGLRWWLETRMQVLVEEGRHEEALDAADELAARFASMSHPPGSRWRVLRAQALHASGRAPEALAAAREELELARRAGAPTAVGRALRVLGTIEGEEGFGHLWESVDVLAPAGSRTEFARALAALGRQLVRTGLPDEAREHLLEALEIAEITGAGGLARELRAELVEIGVEPDAAAPTGVRALTETERRVAALAAEGRSQREIAEALYVTPNAVDVQLGDVFRKLGIESPEELAPALAD